MRTGGASSCLETTTGGTLAGAASRPLADRTRAGRPTGPVKPYPGMPGGTSTTPAGRIRQPISGVDPTRS